MNFSEFCLLWIPVIVAVTATSLTLFYILDDPHYAGFRSITYPIGCFFLTWLISFLLICLIMITYHALHGMIARVLAFTAN